MRYTNTSVTSPSRYVTSSSMWPLHTPMKAISGGGGLQSLLTSDGKRGSEQTLSLGDDSGYYVIAHVFKTFVLLVIISTAMFGNALVIVSVLRTSKLRCVANAFLVSLAFADLLVALLVMTFSASQEILGRWLWGRLACDVFNANDILFSTASLLHLCCISIDRYIAIMDPFHYAARVTVKRVAQMLGVTWTVSALVSHIPVHMGWYTVTSVNGTVDVLVPTSDGSVKCIYMANKTYCLVSSAISFWTPAVVMVVIYVQIYREAERQKTNISRLALGLTASFIYRKGKAGKNKRQAFAVLSSSKARLVGTSQPHVEVKALAGDQSKLHGVRNASPEDGARSTDLLPKVRSTPILRHDVDDDNTCIVVDSARTIVECTDNAELAQILPSYDSDATVDFCTTKQNSSRRCKSTGGAGHARGVSQSAEGGRPATTKAGSTKNKPNGSLIAQSTTRNASLRSVRSEHKAAKTLGIIMGGFLCCWLPFFLWYATVTLCDSCVTPSVLVSALFWIGYANSAVNPAVYALHNRDFRLAFLRQLGCSRLLQKRRERRQAAALYD